MRQLIALALMRIIKRLGYTHVSAYRAGHPISMTLAYRKPVTRTSSDAVTVRNVRDGVK